MSQALLRSISIPHVRSLRQAEIYQSIRMASNQNPPENPSMLHGHAAFVAGAAKVFSPPDLFSNGTRLTRTLGSSG